MAGDRESHFRRRDIHEQRNGGREHRAARVAQDLPQLAIQMRQQRCGIQRRGFEFLDQRPQHRRHQRRANAVAHHVAQKNRSHMIVEDLNVEEVAADGAGCQVTMAEVQRARVPRRDWRHRRILLRPQQRELARASRKSSSICSFFSRISRCSPRVPGCSYRETQLKATSVSVKTRPRKLPRSSSSAMSS